MRVGTTQPTMSEIEALQNARRSKTKWLDEAHFLYVRPFSMAFCVWLVMRVIDQFIQPFFGWGMFGIFLLCCMMEEMCVMTRGEAHGYDGRKTAKYAPLRVIGFSILATLLAWFVEGIIQAVHYVGTRNGTEWYAWPVGLLAFGIAFAYEFVEYEHHLPHNPPTRYWIFAGSLALVAIIATWPIL